MSSGGGGGGGGGLVLRFHLRHAVPVSSMRTGKRMECVVLFKVIGCLCQSISCL